MSVYPPTVSRESRPARFQPRRENSLEKDRRLQAVKAKWDRLADSFPGRESVIQKWWNVLRSNYEEADRSYHNFDRLLKLLKLHEEYEEHLASPDSVLFAIFFHNLIYDPRYTNNEEQSIGKFENFASDIGMSPDSPTFRNAVDLIRLSATHSTDEHRNEHAFGSEDKHYFLDMDMAILGATPYEYTMYSRKIREEYSFLAETIYRQLRAKVLRSLLEITNIFATREFRTKFERQARKNIKHEIELLENL